MNRIDRLTSMILMLQSHRVVTAEKLSAHFEISVRTIYRDIAALGEAGVPIIAEAGVGYSLMRGYNVPPIMFTEEETAALFMSGEVAEQLSDDSFKKQLRSALLKVRSALPEGHKNYLSKLGDRIEVWSRPRRSKENDSLIPVQKAVVDRRCIAIEYDSGARGEISKRTVEALGLTFYSNEWHLIAWCRLRKDIRDFRLDRIQCWEVLKERFSGHESFSLSEYLKHDMEDSLLESIEIECERWALDRVRNTLPATIVSQKELADGRFVIHAKAFSLEWVARWLVGMITAAIATQPAELRELVAAEAEKISKLYKS